MSFKDQLKINEKLAQFLVNHSVKLNYQKLKWNWAIVLTHQSICLINLIAPQLERYLGFITFDVIVKATIFNETIYPAHHSTFLQ